MGLSDNQQAVVVATVAGLQAANTLVASVPIPLEWKMPIVSFIGALSVAVAAIKEVKGGKAPTS